MQLMIRTNEKGMKDYYDWDMNDNETVKINVNEVTQNSRGNWFIKADYEGVKFYANISPADANYLTAGNTYNMKCTGHSGTFKYLSFEQVKLDPRPIDNEQVAMMFGQNKNDEGSVQTILPTSNASDKDCADYLFEHKEQLEKEKYHIDKELDVINRLIMKTC